MIYYQKNLNNVQKKIFVYYMIIYDIKLYVIEKNVKICILILSC